MEHDLSVVIRCPSLAYILIAQSWCFLGSSLRETILTQIFVSGYDYEGTQPNMYFHQSIKMYILCLSQALLLNNEDQR